MNLYWFRNDLRLNDNTALFHATEQDSTIAVFIITPTQWQQHDDASCKVDFWLRQLQQLSLQLKQLNIPLLIGHTELWQDIPDLLSQLCQQHQIKSVYWNQEYGINEMQRDLAVKQRLQHQNIDVYEYADRTLFPVASIKNKSGEYYKVLVRSNRCVMSVWIKRTFYTLMINLRPSSPLILPVMTYHSPLRVLTQ
jgi:Deoxyribodipyrimidine photolyase